MMVANKSKTFYFLSISIIVFVVLAFGSIAIAQPERQVRYIKPLVIIHIFSSLGWLVLLAIQSKLILKGNIVNHKNNRWLAIGLVIISLITSIYITYHWGSAGRFVVESRDVLMFGFFFFLGLQQALKSKFANHKHLMLFAALNLINPALTRVVFLFEIPVALGVFAPILIWVLFPIIYDLITKRKVLKITVKSIVATIVSYAIVLAIAISPLINSIETLLYGSKV